MHQPNLAFLKLKQIIFATNNRYKIKEVEALLCANIRLISLDEANIHEDIPENCDTLEGNALQKARFVHNITNTDCFADDTGLEVETLNNEPGVFSARYAGEQRCSKDNINKLLLKLNKISNRNAQFRTIIALIHNNHEFIFEGVVKGKIIDHEQGSDGFGYDPIFVPNGYNETFAQMPLTEKNKISHRGLAIAKLVEFLGKQ